MDYHQVIERTVRIYSATNAARARTCQEGSFLRRPILKHVSIYLADADSPRKTNAIRESNSPRDVYAEARFPRHRNRNPLEIFQYE
jgi:hypothetical protein